MLTSVASPSLSVVKLNTWASELVNSVEKGEMVQGRGIIDHTVQKS